MENKEIISKLKDNAELAWAAYGYFHFADLNYKPDKYSKDEKRLIEFRKLKAKELEMDLDENAYPTPPLTFSIWNTNILKMKKQES